MSESVSREVWFLRQVEKQQYSKDFQTNLIQVNQTLGAMSKYLIVMQQGIDDLNKDIFETINDFIKEVITIFTGGAEGGGGFDFGDLKYIFQNIGSIFGIGWLTNGIVNIGEFALDFFTRVLNNPVVTAIRDFVNGVLAGLLDLLDFLTFGLTPLDALADFLRGQQSTSTGHTAQIQALQLKMTDGATYMDTFDRNNDFTKLGAPKGFDPWVQGGVRNDLGIKDNAARVDNNALVEGMRWARCPVVASGDNCTVGVAVNPKGVPHEVATTLIIRANADMTEFVYANIFGRDVYIGRGTRTGEYTFNWNDWVHFNKGVGNGAYVEFHAFENQYIVQADGRTIAEYDDGINPPSQRYPVDQIHRTVGFAINSIRVNLITGWRTSWGIAAFSHRPYVQELIANVRAETATAQIQADDAMITAKAAMDELTKMQNDNEGGGISVTTLQERFPGNSTMLNTAKWLAPLGGTSAIAHVNDNAQLKNVTTGTTYYTAAIHKSPLTMNDSVVRMVMGTASNRNEGTGLLINCTSDGGSCVFAQVFQKRLKIGRGRLNPTGYFDILETWVDTEDGISVGNGTQVELRSQTVSGVSTFTVRLNGQLAGSTSKSLGLSINHRYVGFMMHRMENVFGQRWFSAGINSFFASDYVIPALASPGWSVYCTATPQDPSPILHGVNGYSIITGNVFDTLGGVSGLDIVDFRKGRFRIRKTGWYAITFRWQAPDESASGNPRAFIMSSSPSAPSNFDIRRVGPESNGNVYTGSVSCTLYLYDGDIVAPGFYTTNTSKRFIGDAKASITYFEGALMGQ